MLLNIIIIMSLSLRMLLWIWGKVHISTSLQYWLQRKRRSSVVRKLTENAIVLDINKATHTHNYLAAACRLYDYGNIYILPICLLYCILLHFVIALDMSTGVTESGAGTDGPLLLPVCSLCVLLDIMLVLGGSNEREEAHDEPVRSQVSVTAACLNEDI